MKNTCLLCCKKHNRPDGPFICPHCGNVFGSPAKVKEGNVTSMLKAVDHIDGGLTGRTEPFISGEKASELLAVVCQKFLGIYKV